MAKSDLKGQIQGIQLEAILQLAQMEQLTCTMVVSAPPNQGQLFVRDGRLIDAQVGTSGGSKAALAILMWDDAQVEIQESCDRTEVTIKHSVMALLTEAAKRKDDLREEADALAESTSPKPLPPSSLQQDSQPPSPEAEAALPESAPTGLHESLPDVQDDVVIPPVPDYRDKSRPPVKAIAISTVVLVILGIGGYFGYNAYRAKRDYQAVMARVARATDINDKTRLLEAYLSGRESNDYTAAARDALAAVARENIASALAATMTEVDALAQRHAYAEAEARLAAFEKEYPGHDHAKAVDAKRSEIETAYEAYDYAELTGADRQAIVDRVDQLHGFIVRHPDSAHLKDVQALLAKADNAFYRELEKRISAAVKDDDWSAAQEATRHYMLVYPNGRHFDAVRKLDRLFSKNIKETALFSEVTKAAADAGDDLDAARALLADHLAAYPDTHLKSDITDRIARLDRQLYERRMTAEIQAAITRLAPTEKRFRPSADGTVLDTRTRLMWTLLDGMTDRGECLDFDEANAYVTALKTGGHRNWRLPTPGELKALYATDPAFADREPTWYWSSKSERRYAGQWITLVDVIHSGDAKDTEGNSRKYSTECGNVRAVRRAGR